MAVLRSAMWVHGHAFSPEHPADGFLEQVDGRAWTDVVGRDLGWGRSFGLAPRAVDREGDRVDTWFHAAIPTPVIQEGRGLFLDRVFLLFTLQREAGLVGIAAVHLWDARFGPTVLLDHADGFVSHGTGDWTVIRETPGDPAASNVWYPRSGGARPHIAFGLGMSVLVRAYATARRAVVTFHAAGADFVDAPTG